MQRPFVTFLCCASALLRAQNPEEILEKTREKLLRLTRGLARYTCTETIDREYFNLSPQLVARDSCPAVMPGLEGATAYLEDRLRLEVTVAGGREIHAWPGASEFDLRNIDEIVSGPISTGSFGSYLLEVFANPGTRIAVAGRNATTGLFEYTFATPVSASHYRVSTLRRITGYSGTFQIDPETLDLINLTLETDLLPPETGMCVDRSTIDYHRIPTAGGELLLPMQSILTIFEPNLSVSRVRTTFSQCHEYSATSTIRFEEDAARPAPENPKPPPAKVPAGINFTIRSGSALDFATAAAGDRFFARVQRSGDKKALPDGTLVSGRITAIRRFVKLNQYQVSFALEAATVRNTRLELTAAPVRSGAATGPLRGRSVTLNQPQEHPDKPEGSFRVPASMKTIAAGYQTSWVSW